MFETSYGSCQSSNNRSSSETLDVDTVSAHTDPSSKGKVLDCYLQNRGIQSSVFESFSMS